MADRVFKGRLVVTPEIQQQNKELFQEAAPEFGQQGSTGLAPFFVLRQLFLAADQGPLRTVYRPDSILLSRGDFWLRITSDGDLEIGVSGV